MDLKEQTKKVITDTCSHWICVDEKKVDKCCDELHKQFEGIINAEIASREGRKLNAPSNWIIFVVVQRILGFPFFLALAVFGVIILLIKFMANYVKYGGEAISYTEKTRRKMIDDVFHKLVEQQK